MQVYLGLKPKRKLQVAASGPAAADLCNSSAEDAVSRAIHLLHEEFFSTGSQLKHVFTSAQVDPPSPSCSPALAHAVSHPFLPNLHSHQVYSIVSDRAAVDRELQCMLQEGSLRRFRNIGSHSSDDDFFMRNVNYTAALHRQYNSSRHVR
jgi:hypothetical protein